MPDDDCGARYSECVCLEDPDHDGPHLCGCGGSWLVTLNGFEVVAFPGGYPATVDGMFDAWRQMFEPSNG